MTEGLIKKSPLPPFKKGGFKGFTLAEVLITLGIIGIVAAMTMPALIQKNNNRVVETRLMKFYSSINQAVKMAEVDYGDKKIWFQELRDQQSAKEWFEKYLAPYLKITRIDKLSNNQMVVYFPDGGSMVMEATHVWTYFTKGKCDNYTQRQNGVCSFPFIFNPISEAPYYRNKGFEPYYTGWDGTEQGLRAGCISKAPGSGHKGNFCTAIIQRNNWKIPEDYPYKVSY